MATTTKKSASKAKTKTSKAKTTNKASAKKTSAAKSAASSAKVKSASITKKTRGIDITVQKLRSLHIISAGLFLLLVALAGVFMNSTSYQLTLGHLAKDELASTSSTILAPAVQPVYDIELRWAVMGILLISMVLPILYLTKLHNRYNEYLNRTRMVPFRWFDFAVTGALMTEIAALLSGVSDIATLKLVGGLVLTTAVLGLIAERQNNAVDRPVKSAYYTSLFTGLLPWAFIASYAIATSVYGAVRSPWYVYALYAAILGGFALQARNQRMQLHRAHYLIVERNYVAISTLTKIAFAAILIIGLAR